MNKTLTIIQRKISKLQDQSITLSDELKKDIFNIPLLYNHGLARKAEQITAIEHKLQLLYELKEELENEINNTKVVITVTGGIASVTANLNNIDVEIIDNDIQEEE